ncbi:MAG TPA: S-layer homology domain-containing protein [Candidatus Gracilibacteria bacterium]|nr:S-layer homology domain-containing protein [Candidatus Gracilibacteria bacterium]
MTRRLTATILTALIMCATLAAAINMARATSMTAAEILETQIYSGEGFQLLIPPTWTGMTATSEPIAYGNEIGDVPTLKFGLPGQEAMFWISKFTKAQWESLTSTEGAIVPVLLKAADDNIYAYDIASDFAIEVEAESEDIDWIIANITFKNSGLSDVEGDDHSDSIEYLFDKQIVSGYPDGTFKQDQPINRAELMKILTKSGGINPDPAEFHDCFPDVTDQWFAPFVCYAKAQNWIQGYPDGTFKPDQNVNKAEAIKMLINSRGILIPGSVSEEIFTDVDSSAWYAPYIKTAKDKGFLEKTGGVYGIAEAISRGEICENLYRSLILARFESFGSTTEEEGTQETTESQASNEGFAVFVSDSYKFSIEYVDDWFYAQVDTADAGVIRRYEFGPAPIEETPGIVSLELRSGPAPDGTVISDFEGRTIIEVKGETDVNIYFATEIRLYHLHGPLDQEENLIKMASTVTEM